MERGYRIFYRVVALLLVWGVLLFFLTFGGFSGYTARNLYIISGVGLIVAIGLFVASFLKR